MAIAHALSRVRKAEGPYDPAFEHDSCGVAFVATHEAGIPRDISRDNRCESALIPRHPLPLAEARWRGTISALQRIGKWGADDLLGLLLTRVFEEIAYDCCF